MFKGKLMLSGNNAKTVKGDGTDYETAIMYLAPFTMSGAGNVCAMAQQAKCIDGCLNTAGRGAFNNVQKARIAKTVRYMKDRAGFMAQLVEDLRRFSNYCKRKGVQPCVRLNGTSDIMWEKGHPVVIEGVRYDSVMAAFPGVQFYDYTKIYSRADKVMPNNYTLTFSYSAANGAFAHSIRMAHLAGANVAVVFRNKARATQAIAEGFFSGSTVISGDETDMRFLDPKGVVVALYAKGKAKKDQSGFVVD